MTQLPPPERNDGPDPSLTPLALNGGPTENHLPDTASPLVDAIPIASCSIAFSMTRR